MPGHWANPFLPILVPHTHTAHLTARTERSTSRSMHPLDKSLHGNIKKTQNKRRQGKFIILWVKKWNLSPHHWEKHTDILFFLRKLA